jgi:hypothetical protein
MSLKSPPPQPALCALFALPLTSQAHPCRLPAESPGLSSLPLQMSMMLPVRL